MGSSCGAGQAGLARWREAAKVAFTVLCWQCREWTHKRHPPALPYPEGVSTDPRTSGRCFKISKWISFTYSPGTSLTIAFVPGPRISKTTYILQKKYRSPQFPHLPDIRSVGFQSQMFWEASYLQCQLPSIGEQHEAWTFLSFGTSSGSTRSFPFEGCHTRYVFFCDSPSLFFPLLLLNLPVYLHWLLEESWVGSYGWLSHFTEEGDWGPKD